jgi:PAS domain S-box-containing protein
VGVIAPARNGGPANPESAGLTVSQTDWAAGNEPDDIRPFEDFARLGQALTGGIPQRVGWYRWFFDDERFDDERWEWSPEVERIHGYQPGTDTPTTHLVLSHKHPDDYEQVAATLDDIRRRHTPFSTRHRIITVQGTTREVIVIGERLHDSAGEVIGVQGFYFDVTATGEAQGVSITQAIAGIVDNGAVIEQAKGVLMYVYRIDADAAFDVLKWCSQETKVELRALAEQLLADIRTRGHDEHSRSYGSTVAFDWLLLTTRERIASQRSEE